MMSFVTDAPPMPVQKVNNILELNLPCFDGISKCQILCGVKVCRRVYITY